MAPKDWNTEELDDDLKCRKCKHESPIRGCNCSDCGCGTWNESLKVPPKNDNKKKK